MGQTSQPGTADLVVRGKRLIADPVDGLPGGISDGAVAVHAGEVLEVGTYRDLGERHPGARVVGNGQQLLMPGLIDGHSHGWGLTSIQRGILYDFLENALIDWAYMPDIDPELNAMLSGLRHIRNGCTTLHHNSIYEGPGAATAARRVLAGYKRVGIRVAYSPGARNENVLALDDRPFLDSLPENLREAVRPMVDRDKEAIAAEYIAVFDELYREFNGRDTRVILGPTWAQGSTDDFLVQVKEKADSLSGVPIHMHTLQTPVQKAYGLKKYGKSLLQHLDDIGLVSRNLVLGHAVFVTEEDIELLADRGASTTNHPSCNLAMRNGISPVYYLHRAGVNVALGIDDKGINDDEDAIMELRMIHRLHRVPDFDLRATPALTAREVLRMGTVNAGRVCGFEGEIGALRPGMKADMILVDLDEVENDPWLSPSLPIEEAFIHRAKGSHVNTVVIGGEVVMEGREMKTIDVGLLYDEVRAQVSRGIGPEQREFASMMQQVKEHYQKWYEGWPAVGQPFYPMNSRT